jgi:TetR/AcrR family transcriptional regulator of autoinduction and epiphytic fitness
MTFKTQRIINIQRDGDGRMSGTQAKPGRGAAKAPRRPAVASSSEAILRSAKKLFLEAGYDGVNLDRIAETAGVSRQTVYNRFGSKEAVFRSMVAFHWASINLGELFALSENAHREEDATDILRRLALAILQFVAEADQIAFTRLVVSESHRLPWIAEEFYRLGKQPLLSAFVRCLEQMTADGLLDCPHPELAAHQFLGLIQEFIIWPKVMAIGQAVHRMPSNKVVIEEAIRMFLDRYGTDRSSPASIRRRDTRR